MSRFIFDEDQSILFSATSKIVVYNNVVNMRIRYKTNIKFLGRIY